MKAKTFGPDRIELKKVFGPGTKEQTFVGGYEHRVVSPKDLRNVALSSEALGIHLLVEMRDCLTERLDDLQWVRWVMIEAALRTKATIVNTAFHKFNPVGISGVVVIAESHLSIHTWPEHRYAAVDIFSCGETLKPAEAANYLVEQFGAGRASCVEVKRGVFPGTAGLANRVKEGVAGNGAAEPLQMVF